MVQEPLEKIELLFRRLKKRGILWNIASTITVSSVGLFSKLIVELLNQCNYYNIEQFNSILKNRNTTPLITISNHISCFDDPGLWGTLLKSQLLKGHGMRWSLTAHDICFTNKFHSYFFLLGRCLPTVRGQGVYQSAVNFCIEELKKGEWVHVFPEGKVNLHKDFMRLKWGVGRLIFESPTPPIIVPIWHIGMDRVLPNKTPYIFRFGKQLTFNFGNPIDLSKLLDKLKNVSSEEAKKIICDTIQIELMKLKVQTECIHNKHYGI